MIVPKTFMVPAKRPGNLPATDAGPEQTFDDGLEICPTVEQFLRTVLFVLGQVHQSTARTEYEFPRVKFDDRLLSLADETFAACRSTHG